MLKFLLLAPFALAATPVVAGPACDVLAKSNLACASLPLEQISRCIKANKTDDCRASGGNAAVSAAVQPAYDAYIAARAEEHKRLYGQ